MGVINSFRILSTSACPIRYIDVLVQLTRVEGTRHGKLVASQMMDVTIRVKAIRSYAVQCLVSYMLISFQLSPFTSPYLPLHLFSPPPFTSPLDPLYSLLLPLSLPLYLFTSFHLPSLLLHLSPFTSPSPLPLYLFSFHLSLQLSS